MEYEMMVSEVEDYSSDELNEAKQQRHFFYNSSKEKAKGTKNYQ